MKKLYECTSCGFRFYKQKKPKICQHCRLPTVNVIKVVDDHLSARFDGYDNGD